MYRKSFGSNVDSGKSPSDERVKSVPPNVFSVSDNSNDKKSPSDKEDNLFTRIWKMKFLQAPGRAQRVSNVRGSPYSRTPPHRERSRTEDLSLPSTRESKSKSVFRRLSLPRCSGLDSPVFSDIDAWVTDSIAEESDTPKSVRDWVPDLRDSIAEESDTPKSERKCVPDLTISIAEESDTPISERKCVPDFTVSVAEESDTPKSRRKWFPVEKSKGPFIGSYQLLGDSLLVRFADQVLKSPAAIGEHGKYCNGFCVGGQTISDLDERVSKSFKCSDVIVMIGTNDFLRRSRVQNMVNDMKRLMDFLAYTAEKVVILTVPPIPRLENNPSFWHQWESYNKWLKTLDNGNRVKVIDVSHLFLLERRKPDMAAFESHMGYGDKKRIDHIHLNRLGLLRLYREITRELNID